MLGRKHGLLSGGAADWTFVSGFLLSEIKCFAAVRRSALDSARTLLLQGSKKYQYPASQRACGAELSRANRNDSDKVARLDSVFQVKDTCKLELILR